MSIKGIKSLLPLLLITALLVISGCEDIRYKSEATSTTIKPLTEEDAVKMTLQYLSEKYPDLYGFQVYSATLKPSGNWQLYVQNTNSKGIICLDKYGTATGLYSSSMECN